MAIDSSAISSNLICCKSLSCSVITCSYPFYKYTIILKALKALLKEPSTCQSALFFFFSWNWYYMKSSIDTHSNNKLNPETDWFVMIKYWKKYWKKYFNIYN